MKKVVPITPILLIMLALSTPALAAGNSISIYIDGQEVRSEPLIHSISRNFVERERAYDSGAAAMEIPSLYHMDVRPEVKSGRVFVPIRVVVDYFDCFIDWQNPNVILKVGETIITLAIGSNVVLENDIESVLEAAPYIKDGRTMVPLRFISEAFGCDVEYTNGAVQIKTPSLYINDTKVVSAQSWYGMTMGGVRSECKNNICIKKLYQLLQSSIGDEITEPDYFGRHLNLDIHSFYFLSSEISFMESDGLEGNVIERYELYIRFNDSPEWVPNPALQGTDFGKWLIRDITHDKWYQVRIDDFFFRWSDIGSIGGWEVILNDVVYKKCRRHQHQHQHQHHAI